MTIKTNIYSTTDLQIAYVEMNSEKALSDWYVLCTSYRPYLDSECCFKFLVLCIDVLHAYQHNMALLIHIWGKVILLLKNSSNKQIALQMEQPPQKKSKTTKTCVTCFKPLQQNKKISTAVKSLTLEQFKAILNTAEPKWDEVREYLSPHKEFILNVSVCILPQVLPC